MHGEQELNKCIHRHIYRRHVTAPVATTYGLSEHACASTAEAYQHVCVCVWVCWAQVYIMAEWPGTNCSRLPVKE